MKGMRGKEKMIKENESEILRVKRVLKGLAMEMGELSLEEMQSLLEIEECLKKLESRLINVERNDKLEKKLRFLIDSEF